jgi:cytosine/adenosine deaminase-related metal-dependent hydrolase
MCAFSNRKQLCLPKLAIYEFLTHSYICRMRKISADYVFPISSPPIKNGTIFIDDNGIILDVFSRQSELPAADCEVYKGIITPGFVNAHCHLELSHLKGEVSERKGLTGFISELMLKRDKFPLEQIKSAVALAEEEMLRNGIVAVGDISNTDHSFEQKNKNRLSYHTFIEAFDLHADKAQHTLDASLRMQTSNSALRTSITPHAPYSVSGKLMELIDSLKQPLLSIHSQETASENELFGSGTGPLAELMQRAGVDVDSKRSAKNPLLFVLGRMLEARKILLVHNTYTSKEDIDLIRFYALSTGYEAVCCVCPRANLYIENRLPDIPLFIQEGMKLCIGTDSYASNWSLSILDEMKTISKYFPAIPLDTLVASATRNGAEALDFEKELGTIEKGKKPGLNLLTGIDLEKMKLSEGVEVKRLI